MTRRLMVCGWCLCGVAACLTSIVGRSLQAKGEIGWTAAASSAGGERRAAAREALALYQRAREWEPENPRHAYIEGQMWDTLAGISQPDAPENEQVRLRARQAYAAAASAHPLRVEYQMALAWAESNGGHPGRAQQAVERALAVYPTSSSVRHQALSWYLKSWQALTPDDQQRVKTLVAQEAQRSQEEAVELVWSMVAETKDIREILPSDPAVRARLIKLLTQEQYILDRWAELDASNTAAPDRESPRIPPGGIEVISQGAVDSDHPCARLAVETGKPWEGLVEGWISGVRPVTTAVSLPAGEVLLCVSLRGVPADAIWPNIDLKLGGRLVARWTVTTQDEKLQPWFVLLNTPGGTYPLEVAVTNGQVVYRDKQFIERRAAIGPLKILTPDLSRRTEAARSGP